MNKIQNDFYDAFTNLQCYILANMNKGNINGVTATHYNIMEFIYRHENVTGKQIASAFGISQAAISRQIKHLTENDLVTQHQSPQDKRIFYLKISESGRFIIDHSENFRETVTQKTSESLTKEELESFVEILNKMLSVLR